MTEAEWLACDYPERMIAWLTGYVGITGGQAVAANYPCPINLTEGGWRRVCIAAAGMDHDGSNWWEAGYPERPTLWLGGYVRGKRGQPDEAESYQALCQIIRDVAGNPFRPVAFSPAWRTADVLALARLIYDNRSFEDLPVLADAMEEAGCQHAEWCPPPAAGGCGGIGRVHAPADGAPEATPAYPGDRRGHVRCSLCGGSGRRSPLLAHLRSPGPHVRGCWVVNLALGRD